MKKQKVLQSTKDFSKLPELLKAIQIEKCWQDKDKNQLLRKYDVFLLNAGINKQDLR